MPCKKSLVTRVNDYMKYMSTAERMNKALHIFRSQITRINDSIGLESAQIRWIFVASLCPHLHVSRRTARAKALFSLDARSSSFLSTIPTSRRVIISCPPGETRSWGSVVLSQRVRLSLWTAFEPDFSPSNERVRPARGDSAELDCSPDERVRPDLRDARGNAALPDCSPPDLRVATREFSRDPRKNAAGASDAAADIAAGASDAAADNFLAAVAYWT